MSLTQDSQLKSKNGHCFIFSGIAEDKLPQSQPNLVPARNNSYNNIITNYGKKGPGYFGASEARNTWQIILYFYLCERSVGESPV